VYYFYAISLINYLLQMVNAQQGKRRGRERERERQKERGRDRDRETHAHTDSHHIHWLIDLGLKSEFAL